MPTRYSGFDATSFKRDLQRLGRELKGTPEALNHASHVLAAEIRARCPVDTGDLQSTVKVKPVKHADGRLSQEVEVGEGLYEAGGRWYVGFVEFGSREIQAQPFIRPAVRAREAQMLRIIADSMPEGS